MKQYAPTRFLAGLVDHNAPAQGNPPKTLGAFMRWCLQGSFGVIFLGAAFNGILGLTEVGVLGPTDVLNDDEGENWSRVNILAETVEELELIGPSVQSTELLYRLFNEESPRVFDPQPVRFGCTCSEQKVLDSLSTFPEDSLEDMIAEEGKITADCQFCGAHYSFDPAEAKGK